MKKKYSIASIVKNSLSNNERWEKMWRNPNPKKHYDVIIVDEQPEALAKTIQSCLPLLSTNGVIVTTEPMVPTGEIDEEDESKMALVTGFNDLIELSNSDSFRKHSPSDYPFDTSRSFKE